MSTFSDFTGFLEKYGSEANSISVALKALIDVIPIPAGEKATVNSTIDKLSNVPSSIAAAMQGMQEPTPVVINETDIETALKNVLPAILQPMVDEAVAKALAAQMSDGK